ncbi:MAG: prolyl aminopeptidase [Maricaulaceae bacterium]
MIRTSASPVRAGPYPPLQPLESRRLAVSSRHEIYYEICGRAGGLPAVVLHGGPGGGCTPAMRRFFDPARYQMVLFDQRGCGRSRPVSELAENTTWDLVADIERLREALNISAWVVFGGSWGSTLSLAYAQTYPERVLGIVLRGVFLLTQAELDWFYKDGANALFPDAWERFLAPIPEAERADMIAAYHKRLFGADPEVRAQAARAWAQWEGDTLTLRGPSARPEEFADPTFVDAFARIECHYFLNRGYFDHDGQLLDDMHRIAHIPGRIIQGRYDVITPARAAYRLAQAWPAAKLEIIGDAGHSASEPGIAAALTRATDALADLFDA